MRLFVLQVRASDPGARLGKTLLEVEQTESNLINPRMLKERLKLEPQAYHAC